MKHFFKKILILITFIVFSQNFITGSTPKPTPKAPASSNAQASIFTRLQQKYNEFMYGQPKQTSSQPTGLTSTQKLAIKARNSLGQKTKISNQGFIDAIAGTKEYQNPNITKSTNTTAGSTTKNPLHQNAKTSNSQSININKNSSSTTTQSAENNTSNKNITTDANAQFLYQNTINSSVPRSTKSTQNSARNSIDMSNQNQNKTQNSNNSNNPTSKVQTAQNFVKNLFNNAGISDAVINSSQYMSQKYKLIVEKLSQAMNNARNLKTPQEQFKAETVAEKAAMKEFKETVNPLTNFTTHNGKDISFEYRIKNPGTLENINLNN